MVLAVIRPEDGHPPREEFEKMAADVMNRAFSASEAADKANNITPIGFNCVIELDPIEKVTAGGVFIPDKSHDMDQMAHTEATLTAVGGRAFSDFKGRIPEVGDRVVVTKYAGQFRVMGNLEDLHRIVKDNEILAVLE